MNYIDKVTYEECLSILSRILFEAIKVQNNLPNTDDYQQPMSALISEIFLLIADTDTSKFLMKFSNPRRNPNWVNSKTAIAIAKYRKDLVHKYNSIRNPTTFVNLFTDFCNSCSEFEFRDTVVSKIKATNSYINQANKCVETPNQKLLDSVIELLQTRDYNKHQTALALIKTLNLAQDFKERYGELLKITNCELVEMFKLVNLKIPKCDAIPDTLFDLVNLESLDLSDVTIAEIPKEIRQLKNLKKLILSENLAKKYKTSKYVTIDNNNYVFSNITITSNDGLKNPQIYQFARDFITFLELVFKFDKIKNLLKLDDFIAELQQNNRLLEIITIDCFYKILHQEIINQDTLSKKIASKLLTSFAALPKTDSIGDDFTEVEFQHLFKDHLTQFNKLIAEEYLLETSEVLSAFVIVCNHFKFDNLKSTIEKLLNAD